MLGLKEHTTNARLRSPFSYKAHPRRQYRAHRVQDTRKALASAGQALVDPGAQLSTALPLLGSLGSVLCWPRAPPPSFIPSTCEKSSALAAFPQWDAATGTVHLFCLPESPENGASMATLAAGTVGSMAPAALSICTRPGEHLSPFWCAQGTWMDHSFGVTAKLCSGWRQLTPPAAAWGTQRSSLQKCVRCVPGAVPAPCIGHQATLTLMSRYTTSLECKYSRADTISAP